ncbi:hypothetical protein BJX99DRAFT_239550 [Aspergillus californicus]
MDDAKQKVRNRILNQIPLIMPPVLEALSSDSAIRIIGDVANNTLDPKDYFASIYPYVEKVQDCLRECRPDGEILFLAAKMLPGKHSYFVIDSNNVNYDYETAHKCKTPIPIYVLRLSPRQPTIRRVERMDIGIAETIADLHESHGYVPLPLFDNHNDLNRCYPNPRSLRRNV